MFGTKDTSQVLEQYRKARERMVSQQIARRGITDERVLSAMRTVPRHEFVPGHMRNRAYTDSPLPIGSRQTISQPYIVAYMTQLLEPEPGDKILEIGVGSGYQTAVLAEIVDEVIGIERISELGTRARETLAELGYENVQILIDDGTRGCPPQAPYNGILVAAAGPHIPQPLIDQLAVDGKLVIPVGSNFQQVIKRVTRTEHGIDVEDLTPVRFVPLIGEDGFKNV